MVKHDAEHRGLCQSFANPFQGEEELVPRSRTKFPFIAWINGVPCEVTRFLGVYLFDYDVLTDRTTSSQ